MIGFKACGSEDACYARETSANVCLSFSGVARQGLSDETPAIICVIFINLGPNRPTSPSSLGTLAAEPRVPSRSGPAEACGALRAFAGDGT